MTWLLLTTLDPSEWEIVIVFANTGREHDKTLAFIDLCDRLLFAPLGHRAVYIEAVVHPGRKSSTHRVVSFDELERRSDGGKVFEAVIAKYGIPNKSFPHCNRELKLNPIHDYVRSALGWERGTYETAIGIRADEADRINSKAQEEGLIYPLVKHGVRKPDVIAWWTRQPFDLDLPEHRGNCVECWKKSPRKLLTLWREDPSQFDFFGRMEREHAFTGAQPNPKDPQPRRFYRKGWTTLDIGQRARFPFEPFVDSNHRPDPEGLDEAGDCSESCDIYAEAATEAWEQSDLFGEAA